MLKKAKSVGILLLAVGVILLVCCAVTVLLAVIRAAGMGIIGGADLPTALFLLYGSAGRYVPLLLPLGGVLIVAGLVTLLVGKKKHP